MRSPLTQQMIFALSLGFGGVILATQIAFAAPQCDARDRVVAVLAERYGETRRAVGLAGPEAMMELYASDATGTWSLTFTLPDGQMCLMASGNGYEAQGGGAPKQGDPA